MGCVFQGFAGPWPSSQLIAWKMSLSLIKADAKAGGAARSLPTQMPWYQLGLSVEKASLWNIFLKNEIGQPSNSWVVPERQESCFLVENEENHPWPQRTTATEKQCRSSSDLPPPPAADTESSPLWPCCPSAQKQCTAPPYLQKGLADWPEAWSSPVLYS